MSVGAEFLLNSRIDQAFEYRYHIDSVPFSYFPLDRLDLDFVTYSIAGPNMEGLVAAEARSGPRRILVGKL